MKMKANGATLEDFFMTLFDPEDIVCYCKNVYKNEFDSAKNFNKYKDHSFFCVNPVKSERKNADVQKFRNFLFEIDEISLEEQLIHMKNKGMPCTSLAYSGNKSFHFIISLNEPVEDKEHYDFIANWIHNIIEIADKATKNPARLSRLPNAKREDTGKVQRLLFVYDRVKSEDLIEWLSQFEHLMPNKKPKRKSKNYNGGRSNLIKIMEWYIEEYQQENYLPQGLHVQCPVCESEGHDSDKDNMYVSGEEMRFHCFAEPEHNKTIYRTILNLYKKRHTL